MARQRRLDLPGLPQHIVQRGNNRNACFFDDGDRNRYLDLLRDTAGAAGLAVHAYVLMTNHVHLLLTPNRVGAVSTVMQAVGRRYVQRVNALRRRTGTLFDGRFKASLVQTERYLLCCYRYIELNPVRAGLAADPSDYRWSSYRGNALGEPDALLTPHDGFAELGVTPGQRQRVYQAFVGEGITDDERDTIRSHVRQGRVLGDTAFQDLVERRTGLRTRLTPRGRPRSSKKK